MPGGRRDSSKTRVVPVFDRLVTRTDDWVGRLVALPRHGAIATPPLDQLRLDFVAGYWGRNERPLRPPTSLLEWLVRNTEPPTLATTIDENREGLIARRPDAIARAIESLRAAPTDRAWYVLEGATYPDVCIETRDALVVIEGKRTEAGATTNTTWMAKRHQMWRHMDGAWEIRGDRYVFGFFIVEGTDGRPEVPANWRQAARDTLAPDALAGSFPHRSGAEIAEISRGFLGVTTWQTVCEEFQLDATCLPDVVGSED